MQYYSDPSRETDTYALPDVEVFFHAHGRVNGQIVKRCEDPCCEPDGECRGEGWYYWSCFPGCMPDSSPFGPFKSEAEAVEDMRQNFCD